MVDLNAWVGQKTTIGGMGIVSAAVTGAINGTMTWQQAALGIVGGLVLMLLPENAGQRAAVNTFAADVVKAAPTVAYDVDHIIQAFNLGRAHAQMEILNPPASNRPVSDPTGPVSKP